MELIIMLVIMLAILGLSSVAAWKWFRNNTKAHRQTVEGGVLISISLILFFISSLIAVISAFLE